MYTRAFSVGETLVLTLSGSAGRDSAAERLRVAFAAVCRGLVREGYLLGAHTSFVGALPIFDLVGERISHKCSRCRRSLRIIMVERQIPDRDVYSSRKEDGCVLPDRQHL
jgi:hypothetical protein